MRSLSFKKVLGSCLIVAMISLSVFTVVGFSGANADTGVMDIVAENAFAEAQDAVVDQGAMAEVTSESKNALATTKLTRCQQIPCRHFHDRLFNTLNEAAIYFVEKYNAISINQRREYAGYIAKIENGRYILSYPDIGDANSVSVGQGCMIRMADTDAYVHTHAQYKVMYASELFSGGDMAAAQSNGHKKMYLGTCDGNVFVTNVSQSANYGWWFNQFGFYFNKKTKIASGLKHDKKSIEQVFLFKHWGKKKCAACA